jgi:hypothetical protein
MSGRPSEHGIFVPAYRATEFVGPHVPEHGDMRCVAPILFMAQYAGTYRLIGTLLACQDATAQVGTLRMLSPIGAST